MALFSEENLIIPLCAPNTDAASGVELDSFTMAKYKHATVVITFVSTLSGSSVMTVESGASDSADTSDITFHYRLASAAIGSANCDVLAADATASSLTLTAATYQNKMLVLEFDSDELASSGETTYPWVTVDFSNAATTINVSAIAILSQPRYAEAVLDTALA